MQIIIQQPIVITIKKTIKKLLNISISLLESILTFQNNSNNNTIIILVTISSKIIIKALLISNNLKWTSLPIVIIVITIIITLIIKITKGLTIKSYNHQYMEGHLIMSLIKIIIIINQPITIINNAIISFVLIKIIIIT